MSHKLKEFYDDVTGNRIDGKEFNCHYCIIDIEGLDYAFFIKDPNDRSFQRCYSLKWNSLREAFLKFNEDFNKWFETERDV
jgi:hypothetical protein